MSMNQLTTLALLLSASSACATTSSHAEATDVPSATARYFPHDLGNAWAYNVATDLGGGHARDVLSTSQVTSSSADGKFELKVGDEVSRYEVRSDGIFKSLSGYYILKDPITPGARWQILEGRGEVRVEQTGVQAELPSGKFEDCVVVIEEIFQDQRVEWTYAPDVGPVRMRVFLLESGTPALIIDGKLKGYQLATPQAPSHSARE